MQPPVIGDPVQTGTSGKQLDLFLNRSESSLRLSIEDILKRPLCLVLTDNSTSMLSARVRNNVLQVRLHRIFLHADNRVFAEIVAFLKNRRKAMPFFREFVRDNRERLAIKPPNRVRARTRGKVHDLDKLYRRINEEYFGNAVNAAITWGAGSARYAVRKRTLGSFSERSNTIRINPLLDKRSIPSFFVAFIVYHEMLHAALGTPLKGKRRSIHSREFKRRERLFRDFDRAMAWERGGAKIEQ